MSVTVTDCDTDALTTTPAPPRRQRQRQHTTPTPTTTTTTTTQLFNCELTAQQSGMTPGGMRDLENHAIPPRKTTLVLAVPVAPDNTVFIAMCAAKDASKPQGPDVTST